MVSCMAFNPDFSGLLATGSYDNTISLLSTHEAAPEVLSVFSAHNCGITQLQFSKDGRYLPSFENWSCVIPQLCALKTLRTSGAASCVLSRDIVLSYDPVARRPEKSGLNAIQDTI